MAGTAGTADLLGGVSLCIIGNLKGMGDRRSPQDLRGFKNLGGLKKASEVWPKKFFRG
jgi:hypothetical protein